MTVLSPKCINNSASKFHTNGNTHDKRQGLLTKMKSCRASGRDSNKENAEKKNREKIQQMVRTLTNKQDTKTSIAHS